MPLLALGSNGELYEESSINDHGGGVGKLTTFADEGSVVFGAVDARSNYNRRVHRARMKKLAQMKRIQAQKIAAAKRAREQAEKIRKAKINKALKQKQARIDRKKALLFNKARKQRNFGYEYNDLMGDIFEGFENNGTVISGNCPYYGSDFDRVEAFGSNTILGSYHGYGSYDQGMGFSFKKTFKSVSKAVSKAVPKVTMPKNFAAGIKDIGKITAKVVTAPIALSHKALKSIPLLKDVYKGVDKLTGGTLTSIARVNNLANKLAEGKPIKKAEIMEAAMMALKVGAVVASGGSAASLVSAGAGMLKGGPLGKTALGQNLLTLAEVGGAATALYQAGAAKAAEQSAKVGAKKLAKEAAMATTKDVAKKTMQESVAQAVKGKAMDMAKQKALTEVQKKTGIPVGMIAAAYDINKAEASIAEKTKMFATKIGEEKLKKAGLGNAATQAILSGNAQALGVMIKDAPNLAMSKAQREIEAAKIKFKNQASLNALKSKLDSKIAKAKADTMNIEKLKDKIDSEANATIKKQLEKQLANMLRGSAQSEKEIREIGTQYQTEAAQVAVKVAAAEEGRFTADMDKSFKHPIIEVHKKWAGVA